MDIIPDTKDWTWVLREPCGECGFDAAKVGRDEIAAELRRAATAWADVLGGAGVSVRTRADRWSVLEYGCHVRDAFRIFDGRLQAMLAADGTAFENWDQDATAAASRYDLADPDAVAAELQNAAATIADRFGGVRGAEWQRTGLRSDGHRFTVESLGRYLVHDPVHHLFDVGAGSAP